MVEDSVERYDVFIIGAGPGGMECAKQLATKGKKVGLADGNKFGGTCLNRGCIPLKTFLHEAKLIADCKKSQVIEGAECLTLNDEKLQLHKEKLIEQMRNGLSWELQGLGVDLYDSNAQLLGTSNDEIIIEVAGEKRYAKKVIIASGSKIKKVDIFENTVYKILDSNDFLQLTEFPDETVIIGAGAIGIEIASFLSMLGKRVVIVEKENSVGGKIDREIAEKLQRNLERQGIRIYLGANNIQFDEKTVCCSVEGNVVSFAPKCVIMAIGRQPELSGLNLDTVGIKYSDRGIDVDKDCRTNINNIFACGDVTGKQMLAHVAYKQAEIITSAIMEEKVEEDVSMIPMIIYSSPEVATIGETEETCKEKGIDFEKRTISMLKNGRYFSENPKDNCIAKMLVNKSDNTIIGIHIMGKYASEMIICGEVMIANNMTVKTAKRLVFPHPTVGEVIKQLIELF